MQAKQNSYSAVAEIYEHIMRDVKYDMWSEYIQDITERFVKKKAALLELAAGTGKLYSTLSKKYEDYTLTDLSLSMLKKVPHKNKSLKVCCDMTQLPFKRKYDLVVCAFDSVNYLSSLTKLKKLFSEVSYLLTEGGIFLFDASLENNSKTSITEPSLKGKYKGIDYFQVSSYNAVKRTHTNEFVLTYPDGTSLKEKHVQKIFRFNDYFMAIEKAGLYVADCFDNFTEKPANDNSNRAQFVVRKGISHARF